MVSLRFWIEEGLVADLVVFDPEVVADRSTWTEPNRYSEGVIHLVVNGELVLEDGSMLVSDDFTGTVYRITWQEPS